MGACVDLFYIHFAEKKRNSHKIGGIMLNDFWEKRKDKGHRPAFQLIGEKRDHVVVCVGF